MGIQTNRDILPATASRSVWLHPIVLFSAAWVLITFLYSLHLSELLVFTNQQVISAVLWIAVPYLCTVSLCLIVCALAPKIMRKARPTSTVAASQLELRLRRWFVFWVVATIGEIIFSGGLPILWLLRGSSKTYLDFGIPSIHGFLNSLILSIGVGEIALFAMDKKKRHLWIPAWLLVWPLFVVTRNMMIVFLIEAVFTWVLLRGIRWKSLVRIGLSIVLMILVFGYIGDLRSGAEAFRQLAMPAKSYPTWLPSGVLWVYIYLTTPIGNLVNTTIVSTPLHSFLFPNTTSLLFPSVLRDVIYGSVAKASEAFSGNLVSQAFNVSTAYIGPFQDFGWFGVVLFSILLGFVTAFCWRRRGFADTLIYAVIAQCVVLTVFFNHLFYLPVITQAVWIIFFFRPPRKRASHEIASTIL